MALRGAQHRGGEILAGGRFDVAVLVGPRTNGRDFLLVRHLVVGEKVSVEIDHDESALKADAVVPHDTHERRAIRVAERAIHIFRTGKGLGFSLRVRRGILRQFACHPRGLLSKLRGGLRKPSFDGAVHEQVAEQEHEERGRKGKQHCSNEHAGTQSGAEDAAALICEQLEYVARQEHEQHNEEQEDEDRQRGKEEDLSYAAWVQKADVEGVERAKQQEEEEHASAEHPHGRFPLCMLSQCRLLNVRGPMRGYKAL